MDLLEQIDAKVSLEVKMIEEKCLIPSGRPVLLFFNVSFKKWSISKHVLDFFLHLKKTWASVPYEYRYIDWIGIDFEYVFVYIAKS